MNVSEESLRVLASWADAFAGGLPTGRWQGGDADAAGTIQMPWYEYSDPIERFVADMSRAELVRPVDWMAWMATPRAQRLVRDPADIAQATPEELVYLVTAIIRGERFSDGEIAGAYERGSLLALARRAKALLDEQGTA